MKYIIMTIILAFSMISPSLAVDETHANGRIYVYTEDGRYVGSVAEDDKRGLNKLRKKADKMEGK